MTTKIPTLVLLFLSLLPLSAFGQNKTTGKILSIAEKAVSSTASKASVDEKSATGDSLHARLLRVTAIADDGDNKPVNQLSMLSVHNDGNATELAATVSASSGVPQSRRILKHAPGKIVLGQYAARDSSIYDGLHGATMQLVQNAAGEYFMTNVYNMDNDSVRVIFDADNGIVSIPPQLVYKSGSTEYYVYAADWGKRTYSRTDNITGTVDANGVIRLGSWGVFIPTSETSASVANGFAFSTWSPSQNNTSFTDVTNSNSGRSENFSTIVEQTSAKEIAIINFVNNGRTVFARLTSDKRVVVSPQLIINNGTYGRFLCYPVDSTGTRVNLNGNIIGHYSDDGTITFGNFAVIDQNTHSHVALRTKGYTLHTSVQLTWPAATSANFEGQGTSASPYLIKTATDIVALSESADNGNSYQGKYFRLANDIDLSSVSDFLPIGSATTPFLATFDGDGKALKGLSISNHGNSNYGLFGVLGTSSTVKNLILNNFFVTGSGNNVGALAGSGYGNIDAVTVNNLQMNVTGAYAGGIVGFQRGNTISNSAVENGIISAYGMVGGVAGYAASSLIGDHAKVILAMPETVDENSDGFLGGLTAVVSRYQGVNPTVENCYVSGQLLDGTGYSSVGGLAAVVGYATVNQSFNVANISTSTEVGYNDNATGGIVGTALVSDFNDCYNAGTIIKDGTSDQVGGIVGYLTMSWVYSIGNDRPTDLSSFTNCYNSGVIISSPSSENTHRGVWGSEDVMQEYYPHEHYFTNSFSDVTITALRDTVNGRTTAELTTGTLPAGFNSNIWQASAGYYPVFKANASTTASLVSAANISFKDGESPAKFKSAAGIHKASSLKAQLYSDDFTTETQLMKVVGDSLFVKSSFGTGVLELGDETGYEARILRISTVPKAFEGEGTKTSPYLIRNKEDFKKLNEAVFTYSQPYEGDYFLLTDDIDFQNASDFHGVGYGSNARYTLPFFSGDFNGGGHRIKGLSIKAYQVNADGTELEDSCYNYAALFRIVGKYGSVHDIVIDKDNDFKVYALGGSVAGYVAGRVYNVKNFADVNAWHGQTGGVVGQIASTGSVSNSYNAGAVRGSDEYIGGIAGISSGVIDGTQNDGDVINALYEYGDTAKNLSRISAGGIAGSARGSITNSVNQGRIIAEKRVGGIVAQASSITIKGNLNSGTASVTSSDADKGAIAGYEDAIGMTYDGNVYDAAINITGAVHGAKKNGNMGLSTASLVSGTLPAGLNTTYFDVSADKYPVLKSFANEGPSKALRSTFVKFADGEQVNNIHSQETLSSADQLSWRLSSGRNYAIEGNTLKLTSISNNALATDTLTATYGSYGKVYYISSIPQILAGSGTEADPFQIASVKDLNTLADFIASAHTGFKGYFFKVLNDIDYKDDALHVIADNGNTFEGDFDGNKKTISGYVLDRTNSSNGQHLGFFGTIGSEGYVHDLTLNGKLSIYQYGGGFVGSLYGTLRNVVNKGTITTSYRRGGYAGAVAGDVHEGALIDNARNEADQAFTSSYCGGIAARMYSGSTIRNSVNTAKLSSTSNYLGGIVAYIQTGGDIDSCYNTGEINTDNSWMAGIAALVGSHPYSITNSYNTADITGYATVAGIVGQVQARARGTISNCYNTGNMTGNAEVAGIGYEIGAGTTVSYCYNTGTITATDRGNAAGVIGKLDAGYDTTAVRYNTIVDHVWNSGDVTSNGQYTAGVVGNIFGENWKPYITDSYNLGTVVSTESKTSVSAVGGFAGSMDGTIERCWNAGDIQLEGTGAGGIGSIGEARIYDCFNVGNIVASATKLTEAGDYGVAGGIVGYGRSHIINAFNLGTITGPFSLGGIEGSVFTEATIVNTYAAGKISTTNNDDHTANISYFRSSDWNGRDSVANNYYDSRVNKHYDADEVTGAVALPTTSLYDTNISDHFVINRAAYPTLKNIEEPEVQNFFAADTLFQGTDNAQNVTKEFYVGNLKGVTWTSSPNIIITDGVAVGTAGKGWVKKSLTFKGVNFEKQYDVNIVVTTGIDNINIESDSNRLDTDRPMYNTIGQRVGKNYRGVVVQNGRKYIRK